MKTELKAVFGLVVLVRRRGTLNTSHNTQDWTFERWTNADGVTKIQTNARRLGLRHLECG